MIEQAKILRVFKLISLLKTRPKTVPQIAAELETTPRTVYRYIHLIEELGFVVDVDFDNRYFIHTSDEEKDQELSFSAEESMLLQETVSSSLGRHPLKEDILRKLFVHSDLKTLPDQLIKARLGKLVSQLTSCMKNEVQAILRNYHSAHGDTIRDRRIEPFDFGEDFSTVIGFDLEDKENKQFKIERIGEVVALDRSWKNADRHETPSPDIFGITNEPPYQVKLRLSLRAYLLMREEYPRSLPYLSQEGDAYFFVGKVNGLKGIGRFVLGLLDDITVLAPTELKNHLISTIDQARPTLA